MGVGDTVNALDTGKSCIVTVLIDVGRVQCECRFIEFLCELPGKHNAQFGRMFASADGCDRIVIELLVDLRDTARLCAGRTAAADENVDLFRRNALVF